MNTKKSGSKTGWKWIKFVPLYSLILPTFLLLVVFNYYPAFLAFFRSLYEWDVGGEAIFVGLRNFKELFHDPVFRKSVINISKLLVFIMVANLSVPLLVAELIFLVRSQKVNYSLRVLFSLPMMIPPIVIWMLWKFIYSDAGILTVLLEQVGKPEWIYGWLSHPRTALAAVAFSGFPFAVGLNILVYYTGLTQIPQPILESAVLDGAGQWQIFWHIHLPLLRSSIKLLTVLTLVGVLQGFESVYVLTGDGGPGYETIVPGLHMFFNGFSYNRMGYACAIGVMLFTVMLLFTLLSQHLLRSETDFTAQRRKT
ncbi:MAG TPA: sugar ABC transporter permease [bacterium]|jgi:raffinose/stachyose/melibiose transport system permease protein|nr:sugar ABC transporter permease [bacterium]HNT65528.1 sugar ABC transporter permease [bacterium]HOX87414.1 sugar ABC transporter permease [bacterium]HPG46875.1 sugar ABC transporter permease [bacterium]HPM99145.1 sugar ABC transporter permease [bacterium]